MKIYIYKGEEFFSESLLRRAMPDVVFPTLTEELAGNLGITIKEWEPPKPTEEELMAKALQEELKKTQEEVEVLRKAYVQAKMLNNDAMAQEASKQLYALLVEPEEKMEDQGNDPESNEKL